MSDGRPAGRKPRRKRLAVSERVSRVEAFSDRLRRLGATEDEVGEFVAHWDEDPTDRERVVGMSDDALAAAIVEARAEWLVGTGDPVATGVELLLGVFDRGGTDAQRSIPATDLPFLVEAYLDHDDPAPLAEVDVDVESIPGDAQTVARLLAVRQWSIDRHATFDQQEEQRMDALTGVPGPPQPPDGWNDWNVHQVRAWIGRDRGRADLALAIERTGKGRKTIIDHASGVLEG